MTQGCVGYHIRISCTYIEHLFHIPFPDSKSSAYFTPARCHGNRVLKPLVVVVRVRVLVTFLELPLVWVTVPWPLLMTLFSRLSMSSDPSLKGRWKNDGAVVGAAVVGLVVGSVGGTVGGVGGSVGRVGGSVGGVGGSVGGVGGSVGSVGGSVGGAAGNTAGDFVVKLARVTVLKVGVAVGEASKGGKEGNGGRVGIVGISKERLVGGS